MVALEAGHLSQTLYLPATEAGLGAFITGAINEVFLERAFGLDHVREGSCTRSAVSAGAARQW